MPKRAKTKMKTCFSFIFENLSFVYLLKIIEPSPSIAHFYFLSEISSNCYGHA